LSEKDRYGRVRDAGNLMERRGDVGLKARCSKWLNPKHPLASMSIKAGARVNKKIGGLRRANLNGHPRDSQGQGNHPVNHSAEGPPGPARPSTRPVVMGA
jgi:hypothetical protein